MKKTAVLLMLSSGFCAHTPAQIWQPDIFGAYYKLEEDSLPLWELPTSEWMNVVAHFKSGDGTTALGIFEAEYFDGLGRKCEKVVGSAGGQCQDHVYYQEYDDAGRKGNVWLPAIFPTSFVNYRPYAQVCQSAEQNNGMDSRPFSSTVYEDNPLNRATEQYGVGTGWYSHGKSLRTRYLTNVSGNDSLDCIKFSFTYNGGSTVASISVNGSYDSGTLQVVGTNDEDGRRSYEFRNRQGMLVLNRQMMEFGEGSLDTYYLYDGRGNLCVVIPPALSQEAGSSGSLSSGLVGKFAYIYRYDSLNRLSCKKMPGATAVFMAYDAADRLLFSQDGVQRASGKAIFHLYDVFGRECVTGECLKTLDAAGTASISTYARCSYTGQGTLMGYESVSVTLASPVVTSVNYYDSYDFIEDDSLSYVADVYAELMPPKPTGLLTGTACRLLRTGTAAAYELRAFYYDEYNRVIQERSTNMVGGYDNQYKSYDFMGNLLSNRHVHSNAQTTISELTVYTYDNQNRLLTCTHSLNGQPAVTVINNEYDALGRLSANRRNGHALLETHYSYNVRSWLTNISSPLFTETMYYNTEAPFTSTPAYGGNISALSWLSEDSIQRGYSLSYDSASRLTSADYRENETSSTKYQASYTYDANGNVTTLQRYGRYVSDWRLVDDLAYTYQGNRLQRVSKTGVSPKYYGAMYFHDGATANTEYEYDENGNMTKDLNRKISSIQYNLLNLPTKVTMTDDRTISYTYTAEGEKRRVISFVPYGTSVPIPFPDTLIYIPVDPVPFPGLGVTGAEVQGGVLPFNPTPLGFSDTLTYCGNFIYRNGTLKRVLFDGGYVTPGTAGSVPEYHFFIRDHLGNNRLVLSSTGQVEQANHYYPFGATTYESTDSVAQPYKYNGKELERTADVDWYDYGARFYDPVLARFTTMDPLCEKYYDTSPYAYCLNNPVNAVDPDGNKVFFASNSSTRFKDNFAKAVDYLNKNKVSSLLFKLNRSENIYYIKETDGHNSFDYKSGIIEWNPKRGLYTSEDVFLSPTTLLNHEIDHALQYDTKPELFKQNIKELPDDSKDNLYHSKEEKRVIIGSETKTARALGEIEKNGITRNNHSGLFFPVSDPTSNKIENEKDFFNIIIKP